MYTSSEPETQTTHSLLYSTNFTDYSQSFEKLHNFYTSDSSAILYYQTNNSSLPPVYTESFSLRELGKPNLRAKLSSPNSLYLRAVIYLYNASSVRVLIFETPASFFLKMEVSIKFKGDNISSWEAKHIEVMFLNMPTGVVFVDVMSV